MRRLVKPPILNPGVTPDAHSPRDLQRRATFYEEKSRKLLNRKLEARLLEPLPRPDEGDSVVDDGSVATRFTMDREEESLRAAERWVTRPVGPQPRAPWRVVVVVADCGLAYDGAAVLAGFLEGMAEVTSVTLPGRLHRASEPTQTQALLDTIAAQAASASEAGDGGPASRSRSNSLGFSPRSSEEGSDIFSGRKRSSSLGTNEDPTSELGVYGVDARNALATLGFFDADSDDRPWMLVGHGLGGLVAYHLVLAQVRRSNPLSPTLPAHLFVSGCRAPATFLGYPGHAPADEGEPLSRRDDVPLLYYFCQLRRGLDPGPPDVDGDLDGGFDLETELERVKREMANMHRTQQRVLNKMLSLLPPPLREVPVLRQVAAKGLREDCVLLETHVHEAEWPLKLPITAIAGEGDASQSAEDLQGWELETKRAFRTARLPGGSAYPRDRAGARALVDLIVDAANNPPDEDANYSDSDESFEDPVAAAQRARALHDKLENDNPFSLDAYYPLDVEETTVYSEPNADASLKSSALVANSVLGKFAHEERRLTGAPPGAGGDAPA